MSVFMLKRKQIGIQKRSNRAHEVLCVRSFIAYGLVVWKFEGVCDICKDPYMTLDLELPLAQHPGQYLYA